MSRFPLPYQVDDISALARSLRKQLAEMPERPGHLAWLNLLARAAGSRNYQHFAARAAARARPAEAPPAGPAASQAAASRADASRADANRADAGQAETGKAESARIARTARCFDAAGALARWPAKRSEQILALWVLWSRLAAGRVLDERRISRELQSLHLFGDSALLRRELVELGLLTRTPDGSEYRRVERRPPSPALALLALLKSRAAAA